MHLEKNERYSIENRYSINYEILEEDICVYKISLTTITTGDINKHNLETTEGICKLDDLKEYIKAGNNILKSFNTINNQSYEARLVDNEFFNKIENGNDLLEEIERTDKYQALPYTNFLKDKTLKVILFSHNQNLIKNTQDILIPSVIKFDYYQSNITNKYYDLDKVINILEQRKDIIFRDINIIKRTLNRLDLIEHGCNEVVEFSWYSNDVDLYTEIVKSIQFNNEQTMCLEVIFGLYKAKRSDKEVLTIEDSFNNSKANY